MRVPLTGFPIASAIGLLIASGLTTAAHAQFTDEIVVARVIIDARVTDYNGKIISDLGAEDFEVSIAGIPATVEAATWTYDSQRSSEQRVAEAPPPSRDRTRATGEAAKADRPQGRTVVLFVQTDFARNTARTKGQMKFRQHAEKIIRALDAEDRVAVFSFDSHLKFRLDLTTDRDDAIEAFRETIRIDRPEAPPNVPAPSLAEHLDPQEMRDAATSEKALQIVAGALSHIKGTKILLLLGWGLGERVGNIVQMRRGWPAVRRALDAARVTIVALDTTYADRHDLEIGLQQAAEETGGFYAKTHELPDIVVDRFLRTFAGRYEIALRLEGELAPGSYPVDVRVRRRRMQVLAPDSVVIR